MHEGSRRQSTGLTNRNRIEACFLGEEAYISKAQYLHGKETCIYGRYKCEGICALPGEIWWRVEFRKRTQTRKSDDLIHNPYEDIGLSPQKSAEVIVVQMTNGMKD